MSIHFRLNSDATILHVERRSAVNNKNHFEPVARFNLYESIYCKTLSLEEHKQAIIFAKQQREEIRQAYSNYMNNQMFGGTPVVSRGEKYNKQFRELPGFRVGVPSGQFLGCIQGARQLNLMYPSSSDGSEIKKQFDQNTITNIGKEIINLLCQSMNRTPHLTTLEAITPAQQEQLVELKELLSKFIATIGIKQKEFRNYGVDVRVNDFIESLRENPLASGIGRQKIVKDYIALAEDRKNERESDQQISLETSIASKEDIKKLMSMHRSKVYANKKIIS